MEDHFEQFHQKLATNNYLSVCRFCLVPGTMIKVLPPEQLAASKIPSLFKALTDSDMIITPNHPESFCDTCIKELEAAVNIREHFKNIEGFWNQFLNDLIEPIEMKEEIDDIPNAAPIFIETIPMVVDTVEMPKEQIQIAIESMHHQHHHQHHHHQHERKDITTKPDEKRQISIEYVDKDGMSADKRPKKRQKANVAAASTSTSTALNMCDVCGITFTKKTDLNKHVNEYHIKSEMENADIKVASNLLPSIEQPVITVSALSPIPQSAKKALKKKLNCNECNETFTLKRLLVLHLKKHITKKCETCNIEFKSILAWKQHMTVHYPVQNTCTYCNTTWQTMDQLYQHQRLKHKSLTIVECYMCQRTCRKFSDLVYHFGWRHGKGKGTLCHLCGATIKYENFKRHLNTTHAPDRKGRIIRKAYSVLESLKCTFCSFSTLFKRQLTKHLKTSHPKEYAAIPSCIKLKQYEKPKEIRCQICGKICESFDELAIHKETHKTITCHICNRKFTGQQHLDLHLKTHSDKERPFKCSVCSTSFTREPHVKDHFRRMHSNIRPFKCEMCDRSFAQRYELRSHVNIVHLKLKPYKCGQCSQAFATSSSLRGHEASHTGVYRHKCGQCNKGFNGASALGDHIGRHHGKDKTDKLE